MLEAIGLTKRYNGETALDALDLRIEPGEIFCLLGANGLELYYPIVALRQ